MAFVNHSLQRRVSRIRPCIALAFAFAFVGATQAATAQTLTLTAQQDPAIESQFTMDFGKFGGPRTANISNTSFTLELDAAAPSGESAKFLTYHQDVEPLFLPNPQGGEDLSTGPLTITIEESYGGTYDPDTGEVTTFDLYRIDFGGDLTAFGIESPVFMEGASLGTVGFATARRGNITLEWEGVYELSGLTINYVCETNTVFTKLPQILSAIETILPGFSWLLP